MLAQSPAVWAQPTSRARRVGLLGISTAAATAALIEVFRAGLRELGWVEGQNLAIEYRFADGDRDRLGALAADLVRLDVDLIVAIPTAATVAAQKATRTIPIVMFGVSNPVGLGLVTSLARPAGNVTGLSSSVGPEIAGKQLELLKATVPHVRRVAVLSNAANEGHAGFIANLSAVAPSMGVQLQTIKIQAPTEFDDAFATMSKNRVEALVVLGDPLFNIHAKRLASLEVGHRLPSMHFLKVDVDAGCLMSYGPNLPDQHRRIAIFVDKILRGARPADLPVEQPTKFELAINLGTAKAMRLTIPPAVLLRADQVIQ